MSRISAFFAKKRQLLLQIALQGTWALSCTFSPALAAPKKQKSVLLTVLPDWKNGAISELISASLEKSLGEDGITLTRNSSASAEVASQRLLSKKKESFETWLMEKKQIVDFIVAKDFIAAKSRVESSSERIKLEQSRGIPSVLPREIFLFRGLLWNDFFAFQQFLFKNNEDFPKEYRKLNNLQSAKLLAQAQKENITAPTSSVTLDLTENEKKLCEFYIDGVKIDPKERWEGLAGASIHVLKTCADGSYEHKTGELPKAESHKIISFKQSKFLSLQDTPLNKSQLEIFKKKFGFDGTIVLQPGHGPFLLNIVIDGFEIDRTFFENIEIPGQTQKLVEKNGEFLKIKSLISSLFLNTPGAENPGIAKSIPFLAPRPESENFNMGLYFEAVRVNGLLKKFEVTSSGLGKGNFLGGGIFLDAYKFHYSLGMGQFKSNSYAVLQPDRTQKKSAIWVHPSVSYTLAYPLKALGDDESAFLGLRPGVGYFHCVDRNFYSQLKGLKGTLAEIEGGIFYHGPKFQTSFAVKSSFMLSPAGSDLFAAILGVGISL